MLFSHWTFDTLLSLHGVIHIVVFGRKGAGRGGGGGAKVDRRPPLVFILRGGWFIDSG